MSDGILPSLGVFPIIRVVFHDEFVDLIQTQAFFRASTNRHHNQRVERIRWSITVCIRANEEKDVFMDVQKISQKELILPPAERNFHC